MLGDSPHPSEAAENTATPPRKTVLRPNRSATVPRLMISAASGSVYASTVHCRPLRPPPSRRPIAGSAACTIVMSSKSMNVARHNASSFHRSGRITAPPLSAWGLAWAPAAGAVMGRHPYIAAYFNGHPVRDTLVACAAT